MTWNDLIGFLISLGAFLFLMFRHAFKERHDTEQEEDDEIEEEEEELILPPIKKREKPRPPVPRISESAHYDELTRSTKERYSGHLATNHYAEVAKSTKERYSGSNVVSSHYDDLAKSTPYVVEGKARSSRIHRILSQLKSKKDMVIFKEIIGPPKGL